MKRKEYEKELRNLQAEMCLFQDWVKAEGKRVIRLGIALHVGDVAYGNIGTPARLDFTVIGPAVNKVVRIEALSKALDRSLLLSSDFAKACVYPVDSLGFHPLRGISEPEEIFAPSLTGREAIVRRAAIRRDN